MGDPYPLSIAFENSLADWYSSLLLAIGALLLFCLGRGEPEAWRRPYWMLLAVIFLCLSIDEGAALHELLPQMAPVNLSGLLRVGWVWPFLLLCIALAAIFLRFVLSLPEPLRGLIFLAGAIYVFSALGLEMVEGYCGEQYGGDGLCFQITMRVQECGEMIGLTIFVTALFAALQRSHDRITIALRD